MDAVTGGVAPEAGAQAVVDLSRVEVGTAGVTGALGAAAVVVTAAVAAEAGPRDRDLVVAIPAAVSSWSASDELPVALVCGVCCVVVVAAGVAEPRIEVVAAASTASTTGVLAAPTADVAVEPTLEVVAAASTASTTGAVAATADVTVAPTLEVVTAASTALTTGAVLGGVSAEAAGAFGAADIETAGAFGVAGVDTLGTLGAGGAATWIAGGFGAAAAGATAALAAVGCGAAGVGVAATVGAAAGATAALAAVGCGAAGVGVAATTGAAGVEVAADGAGTAASALPLNAPIAPQPTTTPPTRIDTLLRRLAAEDIPRELLSALEVRYAWCACHLSAKCGKISRPATVVARPRRVGPSGNTGENAQAEAPDADIHVWEYGMSLYVSACHSRESRRSQIAAGLSCKRKHG